MQICRLDYCNPKGVNDDEKDLGKEYLVNTTPDAYYLSYKTISLIKTFSLDFISLNIKLLGVVLRIPF